MLTTKITKKTNGLPVALLGMMGALLLSVTLANPVLAAEPFNRAHFFDDGETVRVQGPRQSLTGDLTVEDGEVIDDDVSVISGNVYIKDGGRITGDLFVGSGNIEIDEDSAVGGDVTNTSGNVQVSGHIGGDLAVMSGDVELDSSARVDGDISVISGSIDREEGATVGGNVVQGPSFRFPRGDDSETPRAPTGVTLRDEGPNFFEMIVGFIGRLIAAALMTAFIMLLVGGLFYLRPQIIADTRKRMNEQLALSAVVGVLANLTILFLAGLLTITICLAPLALVPMLFLLAINVVGWAVASQIVGERIVKVAKQEIQPALKILVGAFFLTGVCALLWAIGGCFRPLAFLLALAASSVGTGAALLPWINRRRGSGGTSRGGGDVPPSGPVPSGSASPQTVSSDFAPKYDVPAETNDVVEHDLAAPLDYMTAEEINATAEQPAPDAAKSRARTKADLPPSPAVKSDDPIEQDASGPIDYVTAQEVNTTDTVSAGDDFLRIKGIGPTYARRLKDAGFATFAQVAAATPEEVAAAIGWPVDRVKRAEVIDQAKVLAR